MAAQADPPRRRGSRTARAAPVASTGEDTASAAASTGRRTPCRESRRPASSRRGELLFEQLLLVQLGVQAGAANQLVMTAAFDDTAVVDDENQVRVPDGGDPVRDDDRGPLPHDVAKARQD